MVCIVFVQPDGDRVDVAAEVGTTVMEAAVRCGVSGIDAECGGACSCATCHVYVDESWIGEVGCPSEDEEDTLDLAYDVRPVSRLSCQIRVKEELDGLILHLPERQG